MLKPDSGVEVICVLQEVHHFQTGPRAAVGDFSSEVDVRIRQAAAAESGFTQAAHFGIGILQQGGAFPDL